MRGRLPHPELPTPAPLWPGHQPPGYTHRPVQLPETASFLYTGADPDRRGLDGSVGHGRRGGCRKARCTMATVLLQRLPRSTPPHPPLPVTWWTRQPSDTGLRTGRTVRRRAGTRAVARCARDLGHLAHQQKRPPQEAARRARRSGHRVGVAGALCWRAGRLPGSPPRRPRTGKVRPPRWPPGG